MKKVYKKEDDLRSSSSLAVYGCAEATGVLRKATLVRSLEQVRLNRTTERTHSFREQS